nr:hypothetical protein [Candidatus Sigynarchaeum springense]
MSQDMAAISRRVQRLESSIIICIGAGICVAAMVMSTAAGPNLAMWAMTMNISGHSVYYAMSAFGTLSISDDFGYLIIWPGLVGNVLPCITIIAGVMLSLAGIKKRKAGIVGGLIAIASPLVLVALLLSYNIAFTREVEPFDVIGIRELFLSLPDPNPLAGTASCPPYTLAWGIGISTYLPIAGGGVVLLGIVYNYLARERRGQQPIAPVS